MYQDDEDREEYQEDYQEGYQNQYEGYGEEEQRYNNQWNQEESQDSEYYEEYNEEDYENGDYQDENYQEYQDNGYNENDYNENDYNENRYDENNEDIDSTDNVDNTEDEDINNTNNKKKSEFNFKDIKQKINIKQIKFPKFIKKKTEKNQNSKKEKKGKKERKKDSVKSKLLLVLVMSGMLVFSLFCKQKMDEKAEENRPVATSSKQELTSAELYQQKVNYYSPILNKTLFTLNDKTLDIQTVANQTDGSLDPSMKMQIITNTKGNQIFFKTSYERYAVITIFSENDVYVALTNAKSTLQKPIRLYHSVVTNENVKNKIYNQYLNIDILNKQLKNSISFNYQTTKDENGGVYDILGLNVPRYEFVENSVYEENKHNDNGVTTTIVGNGGLSVNKPTSQTEKMLIHINPDTKEIYRIEKTINELDYVITIKNENKLSIELDGKIEEISENNISMILASELNYSACN